jgi:hypothetical protein
MMAPKGAPIKNIIKQAYALQIYRKSKLMVVDIFCLFSKLTLVASMYPVLTVLLFAILRFLTFAYSYTRIKCHGSVFFF